MFRLDDNEDIKIQLSLAKENVVKMEKYLASHPGDETIRLNYEKCKAIASGIEAHLLHITFN